jgi:molecular chaperone Hsp33
MTAASGDAAATFLMEGAPVRGRYARLGALTLDPILKRHAYPRASALLLGEALALAVLVGSLSKTAQVLTVQAEGDGPMPLLVAEWRAGGAVRGYARIANAAKIDPARMNPASLIGQGALAITVDQGPDADVMQGIVALEGETLADCAQAYFTTSEQTPTRVKLAVGEVISQTGAGWRAGGALIQRVAGDDARGDTAEGWARAKILFETLGDDELLDPALGIGSALYRLFHEDGVRMGEPEALMDRCTCNLERLKAVLARYTPEELDTLRDEDGGLHATCQFCSRVYDLG